MLTGNETKGHAGAEGDAAARVVAAKDARHVVADRIEPGDCAAILVQNPRVAVGAKTGKGADAARNDPNGVERSVLYRR